MDQHSRLGGDRSRLEPMIVRLVIDGLEAVALMCIGYVPPSERGLRFGAREHGPSVELPARSGRREAPRKETR